MAGDNRRAASGPVPVLDPDIRLSLPARPEYVSVARQVVTTLAETLTLSPAVTEDLRLAVTEACTNVVRHAYHGDEGEIELLAGPDGDALVVIVADTGRGLGPSQDTAGPGLGLPLIAALSDSVEIEGGAAGAGSRLTMSFPRDRTAPAMGLA